MKLLQINVTANSGSTGKIAEQIGRLVIAEGWQSSIAYGRYANPSQSELICIGTKFDIIEHGIESRLLDNHGLASHRATKSLIQQIENIKPDIIHLHNIHGYYINYKILFEYLSKLNTPIVWTLHDCWPLTGHCAHFDYVKCDRWKKGCFSPCPCKENYPKSLLVDRSQENWEKKKACFTSVKNMTIVSVSQWLSNLVNQSFLKKYPIRIIHNGIDLKMFSPIEDTMRIKEKYHIEGIHILLGVANVWNELKGLSDFIKLRELLPIEYTIVLVGLTEKQILLLPKGIIGIKHTQTQEELVQLYSVSNVYINPTYEDSYPTTNLEAVACGTPAVTYKTGGSPESISEESGIVIKQGDINQLACVIRDVCTRGKEYYLAKCRQYAERNFSMNHCFEQYVQLYKELVSRNG